MRTIISLTEQLRTVVTECIVERAAGNTACQHGDAQRLNTLLHEAFERADSPVLSFLIDGRLGRVGIDSRTRANHRTGTVSIARLVGRRDVSIADLVSIDALEYQEECVPA